MNAYLTDWLAEVGESREFEELEAGRLIELLTCFYAALQPTFQAKTKTYFKSAFVNIRSGLNRWLRESSKMVLLIFPFISRARRASLYMVRHVAEGE